MNRIPIWNAPGLYSASFTMYGISYEDIQEWDKCLHLHIWVVQYRGNENVTPGTWTDITPLKMS